MTTYYVATLAAYVLVDAADEDRAKDLAIPKLRQLHVEATGVQRPIVVRTVRPATDDEMRLQRWHDEAVAHEVRSR